MKTSNVIGVAAAAALLTVLELGIAATLLGTKVEAQQASAAFEQPTVALAGSAFTLEPIVVLAVASD